MLYAPGTHSPSLPGNAALSATEKLPAYASMLSAYHRAYAPELKAMVASLPVHSGNRVLDLACGDGVYANWLAEGVGPRGSVTALDVSPAFLDVARANTAGGLVQFVAAAAERMPFADATFDLVWCAQSLYSLPDPVEAIRLMARVVRQGGTVAVLENDSLHHILLPWPIEVELAVRQAELLSLVKSSDKPRKYYVGRQLIAVFRKAGLTDCRNSTRATNRAAPLSPDVLGFLEKYLNELRDRALPHLEPKMKVRFETLVDPGSDSYLLHQPDLTVTCLDHVVLGVKP